MLIYILAHAGVVELVDAIDSKSIIGNYVWVRVPPPAPNLIKQKELVSAEI